VSGGGTGAGASAETSGVAVFVGKRATVGVTTGVWGNSLIRRGVLVGVGVTCRLAREPQAKTGRAKIIKINNQNKTGFLIGTSTSYPKISSSK
jgi:hypothetical protein